MEDVRKDPYSLPASFQWSDLNLDNDEEVKELYTLLHENYVEDGDAARSRARRSQRLGGAWARRLRLRKARSAALGSFTRLGAVARSLRAPPLPWVLCAPPSPRFPWTPTQARTGSASTTRPPSCGGRSRRPGSSPSGTWACA